MFPTSVFAQYRHLVFVLAALFFLCGESIAQEFRTVRDGVEYAAVTREISGLKVNINLLRLDLQKVRLDVVHANDSAIGTETTSSIASRNRAIAAINAGFFRLDNSAFAGDPAGVLQIDGKLLSEANNGRVQLLIENKPRKTDVFIAHLLLTEKIRMGAETIDLTGINRERTKEDLIMYTPEFGRTTMTSNDGVEVLVSKYRILGIKKDLGDAVIPADGFVLSGTGKYRDWLLKEGGKNDLVTFVRHADGLPSSVTADPMTYPSEWDIVGGVPQLIKNGRIQIEWEAEKTTRSFVETRHPRTAVAILKDGKFLMITVDGRSESSGGIGLQDLAEYLLSIGAVDAMNLDGGGSTTMYLDGKVVNVPSDKEGERKVSDAIIVTQRTKGKN